MTWLRRGKELLGPLEVGRRVDVEEDARGGGPSELALRYEDLRQARNEGHQHQLTARERVVRGGERIRRVEGAERMRMAVDLGQDDPARGVLAQDPAQRFFLQEGIVRRDDQGAGRTQLPVRGEKAAQRTAAHDDVLDDRHVEELVEVGAVRDEEHFVDAGAHRRRGALDEGHAADRLERFLAPHPAALSAGEEHARRSRRSDHTAIVTRGRGYDGGMKRASAGSILVLFARPPKRGEVKTRLASALGEEKALALYRAFLLDSIELLHRVSPHGIRPAIAWAGAAAEASADFTDVLRGVAILEQQGDDLGQRMSGALAELLARGHDRVAIIGADTPSLPLENVLRAFELLRGRDVVLGPSADGGYYLLGARAVVPEIFRGIPWGTDRVLEETLRMLKILGLPRVTLPVCRDVDDPEDLDALRRDLAALRETDPTARNTRQVLAAWD